MTRTLVGESMAATVRSARAERLVARARAAGLDDESIEALFLSAFNTPDGE